MAFMWKMCSLFLWGSHLHSPLSHQVRAFTVSVNGEYDFLQSKVDELTYTFHLLSRSDWPKGHIVVIRRCSMPYVNQVLTKLERSS